MSKVAHIIGNGDKVSLYEPSKGIKIACNIPPFPVNNLYATVIVDFKMCRALHEGEVTINGSWLCGFRPKKYSEMHPSWYMKFAPQIKEFYTTIPKYTNIKGNDNLGQMYTNFNCGHLATHWAANKLKADEIHLYGFDSLFDWNMRSYTDLVIDSDRGNSNSHRLIDNWRPVWSGILKEFSNTQFVFYHNHDKLKIPKPENVEIRVK